MFKCKHCFDSTAFKKYWILKNYITHHFEYCEKMLQGYFHRPDSYNIGEVSR